MTTTEILTGIKDWVLSKLSLKQDVINDLSAIRSGSQAGSTAVQPSDLSSYFNNASYDTNTHRINFYHGQNIVAYVDASPFIVDGMVDDVRIENGYLVIDFNTESGKQDISIPLTDIFDPSNYYNKTRTDGLLAQKQDVIQDLANIRSGAGAGATAVQPEELNSALSNTVAESGIFDLSVHNAVNGVPATYDSLSAAITALNALPATYKTGGMSFKFIHSSDNKYVQYRLMSDSFNTTPANWQGVDEEPTAGSDNLVKSGGTESCLNGKATILAGKNKCNPDDSLFKLNVAININDGTEIELASQYHGRVGCTGYIPVSENGLRLNYYAGVGVTTGMAVYNSNKEYIRGAQTSAYTWVSGDAFVRFTFAYNYRNEIQVEEGTSVTTYVAFNPVGGYPCEKYLNGTVDTNALKDGAVVESKIGNNAISTDKIKSGAVSFDKIGIKFFQSSYSYISEYEKGLQALFVDKSLLPVTNFTMKYYNGAIRMSYKTSSSEWTALPNILAANIENNTQIPIIASNNVVGYVVFNDKLKFINNPAGGSDIPILDIELITSSRFNIASSIAKNAVSSSNLQKDAVETEKVKDGAITKEKTDFFYMQNKCNPADPDFKLNYQITYTTGAEFEWTGSNVGRVGCTGYIPISENGLILNHYGSIGVSSGMAVYNSNKEYIRGDRSGVYTYQDGDAYVRFTFDYNFKDEIQVQEGDEITSYMPYGYLYFTKDNYMPVVQEAINQKYAQLPTDGIFTEFVKINLPKKIYAVRGNTLQIFYRGIVVAPNLHNYDIRIECSKGKGLYRLYEYQVGDNDALGEYDWTIIVSDQNRNVLGTKACKLVVVDKAVSPSSIKNILCIGDSLTANGTWPAEMKRMLTGTAGTGSPAALGLSNLNFIGSINRVIENIGSVDIEGHSGWGWYDYVYGRQPKFRFYLSSNDYSPNIGDVYTNNSHSYTVEEVNIIDGVLTILTSTSYLYNTPEESGVLTRSSGSGTSSMNYTSYETETSNPFWDGAENKLSFVNYVENVLGLSQGTKIDYAYILMTWNQIPEYNGNWAYWTSLVKSFIDALHADYPDCKVKLMPMQFIYPEYFIAAVAPQDSYGYILRAVKMNEIYESISESEDESGTSGDTYSSFVEYVNVSSQFDSEYNMSYENKAVNTRNIAVTEKYTNNSIHPGISGYLQIADVAYRNISKELL